MLFGRTRYFPRLTRPFPAPSALAPSFSLYVSQNSGSSADDHPTRSPFRSRLPAKVYLFAANVYPLPRKGYQTNRMRFSRETKSSFRRSTTWLPGSRERGNSGGVPPCLPAFRDCAIRRTRSVARWQRRGVGHTEFAIQS